MGVFWINLSVLWSFLCQKRAFGGRKQLMDYGKNIRENSCFPSPWLCSLKSPFKLGKWHGVSQAKAAPPPHSAQVWGRKSGHNCKVWNPNRLHLFSPRQNTPLFFKLWVFLKKTPKFHPGNFWALSLHLWLQQLGLEEATGRKLGWNGNSCPSPAAISHPTAQSRHPELIWRIRKCYSLKIHWKVRQ